MSYSVEIGLSTAVVTMNKTGVLLVVLGSWWGITEVGAQGIAPPARALTPRVEVIAKTYLDSVVIRWAPNQASVWQYGNRYGYIIERATLAKGGKYNLKNPPSVTLTPQPLKPLPLAEWEPIAQHDKYAAIAAQAIYGESFELVDPSNTLATFVGRAKETENRFSFSLFAADQSVATARAHGLRIVDHDVRADEKYRYRVRVALPKHVRDSVETGFVFLAVRDTASIPAPQKVEVHFGDRVAQLSWNKRYYERTFTSYLIERTDNLSKGFTQLEQPPLVSPISHRAQAADRMYSTDSLADNTTTYYYRIRGVTAFGEIGPPSDTLSGHGISAGLPVTPAITEHALLLNGQVQIGWEFDTTLNNQLQGFHLLRSDQADGPVDTLTTNLVLSTARSIIDPAPLPVNYYQLVAVDQEGRTYASFPTLVQLEDSIPPVPPVALSGAIDTAGAVIIRWQANSEPDLLGYRVLMSNHPEGSFVQISDALLTDSIYYGTTVINTLTRYIYYQVVAVDEHYNRSVPSATLRLERPDCIPPATPIFRTAASQDSAIYLTWHPSASDDAVRHILYRRMVSRTTWTTLAILDSTQTTNAFQDTSAVPGRSYKYTLVAVDRAGLESPTAPPVQVAHIDYGLRENVTEFYSKVDRTEKRIELAWNYPSAKVERYLVFRQVVGQPLRLLKSVPSGRSSFQDRQLVVNTVYIYRIQAIYRDGGQSPLSEELTVQY